MDLVYFETSVSQLAAAFTEWERRWREEPAKFQSDMERLAGTSEGYGEAAAAYLMEVWNEQRAKESEELQQPMEGEVTVML